MRLNEHEKIVGEFYDNVWPEFVRWWYAEETLGLHYAFYEDGIKSFKEAVYNMNEFVGRLLCLNDNEPMDILDAGCGVGGTSIYLGNKYPKVRFTGITVASDQVKLAKKFANERQVHNASFMLSSYFDTKFSDNFFDGVFALESTSYATDIKKFADEIHRILKPGGRLVVIDGFRKNVSLNPIMQKIYYGFLKDRGYAHLSTFDTYISHLKKLGFIEIEIKNIAKNVSRSQLRSFVIGIPFFFSMLINLTLSHLKIST